MKKMQYLITGGAGFMGANFANKLLQRGDKVIIWDNCHKPGSLHNLNWLKKRFGSRNLKVLISDIQTDHDGLKELVASSDVIFHLAAQTAVTHAISQPTYDFASNLQATFHLLETVRTVNPHAILIYASTNKVYGPMPHLRLKKLSTRYVYHNLDGINERHPLHLHTPYACSKGAADCYVQDYARVYGLKTVVFRQSCIYGPRQFGTSNQGWLAWFAHAFLIKHPITIYGDGKQTRDALFVDDLFHAWDMAVQNIDQVSGEVFNIGGGKQNTLSLLELIDKLEAIFRQKPEIKFGGWRPGDQKIFISDNSKLQRMLGWQPSTHIDEGLREMIKWMKDNRQILTKFVSSDKTAR